ncbi:MAG: hypothetical protein EPO02_05065 [Nitrospirae bacterium]|nr:MAG: hypothetical protein EPO02_05065 [Nitrospirota bacterium]
MAVAGAGGGGSRGRSLAVMAKDIMEGYVMLNPLVLKKFDAATFKELHMHLRKMQTVIRSAGVDLTDQEATRNRNQKLQRMHQAMAVLENQAKIQKIILG